MELIAVSVWMYADDVVRIGILVTVIINIIVLRWIALEVKSVISSWRLQHEQRTPIAAAYGMAVVLQSQHMELAYADREKIFNALVEQLGSAVNALDAGSYMQGKE